MPDRFYTQTFLPAMTIAGAVHSDIFGRESQLELFFAFRLKSIARRQFPFPRCHPLLLPGLACKS